MIIGIQSMVIKTIRQKTQDPIVLMACCVIKKIKYEQNF